MLGTAAMQSGARYEWISDRLRKNYYGFSFFSVIRVVVWTCQPGNVPEFSTRLKISTLYCFLFWLMAVKISISNGPSWPTDSSHGLYMTRRPQGLREQLCNRLLTWWIQQCHRLTACGHTVGRYLPFAICHLWIALHTWLHVEYTFASFATHVFACIVNMVCRVLPPYYIYEKRPWFLHPGCKNQVPGWGSSIRPQFGPSPTHTFRLPWILANQKWLAVIHRCYVMQGPAPPLVTLRKSQKKKLKKKKFSELVVNSVGVAGQPCFIFDPDQLISHSPFVILARPATANK